MLIIFGIALICLGYLWLKHHYTYWERRGVKGPKPVFLFGNLYKSATFQEHVSIAHRRWYNTYTDVPYVGYYKFLQPALMIRDPELQREVLVKAFMNFQENDLSVSDEDDLLKANPFFNKGEEWRQSRAIFGSFFSANKTRSVFPCMLQVGKEWEQYIRSLGLNAEVDAKDVCSRFTTETMLRCTFSINGKSFEKKSEFLDMGKSVFNPDTLTAIKTMLTFFIPAIHRIVKTSIVPPTMSRDFKELVRDQIKIRDSGSVQCEDVLQFILNGREKYEMDIVKIAGICAGFFVDSYETSANALMLALYELAKNTHIQDELSRRIKESIADNNNEITYDLVNKHEYLEKVLFETMRRQPTFFGIQKLCTKAYTMPLLPGHKEAVTIPAGTPVLIPFAAVSQPRMCIGMHQGLFNLKMGLFQMIRYFDVKFGPNQKPFELHPMSFFNIPKNGFKFIFTQRKAE